MGGGAVLEYYRGDRVNFIMNNQNPPTSPHPSQVPDNDRSLLPVLFQSCTLHDLWLKKLDTPGKFGEHEGSARVARGAAGTKFCYLSALQVHPWLDLCAQLKAWTNYFWPHFWTLINLPYKLLSMLSINKLTLVAKVVFFKSRNIKRQHVIPKQERTCNKQKENGFLDEIHWLDHLL